MNQEALTDNRNPAAATRVGQIFYVVSIKKFSVLFVATLGLYSLYWYYRNWACYKSQWASHDKDREDLWPIARAFFAVFFVHSLFREVKALGRDKPAVEAWESGKHATQLVVLMIASQLLDRLAYREIGSPYTDTLSLIILAPLLLLYTTAQEKINASCDDPGGHSNTHFTAANYAWIIGGAIFWCLVLLNYILPD